MSKTATSEHVTTDRLSESAHESVKHIAETAGKAEERIRHGAADAEAYARDAGHKAKDYSDKTLDSVSGFVREKPFTSIGIAVVAGALLSLLKRRS